MCSSFTLDFSQINPEDNSLYDYQLEAKQKIYGAWQQYERLMFQMPTGGGKTKIFVSIINDCIRYGDKHSHFTRVLIIAHRIELIQQIKQEVCEEYQIPCNLIAPGEIPLHKVHVQVASIQTLTKRTKEWENDPFDLIIVDEAHHIKAKSYKDILRLYPNAKVLGVTASPYRLNGDGFTDQMDKLIVSEPIYKFIEKGRLCDYEYYSTPDKYGLIKRINSISQFDASGDFSNGAMMRAVDTEKVTSDIIASYQKYALGKKGIVYAINRQHGEHICQRYKNIGVNAVSIDCGTRSQNRNTYVEQFRKGEIEVIVNVNIFGEGFDCPDVQFIQLARPTMSLSLYLQQVGRGLRNAQNKDKVIIIDNVGQYKRFGLPSAYRDWNMFFKGTEIYYYGNLSDARNEDTHQARIMDFIQDGDEETELIYSSKNMDIFCQNLDCVQNYKDEFVEYLCSPKKSSSYTRGCYEKRMKYSSAVGYARLLELHFDKFVKDYINPDFVTIFQTRDKEFVGKLNQTIMNRDEFDILNNKMSNRLLIAWQKYISFVNEYDEWQQNKVKNSEENIKTQQKKRAIWESKEHLIDFLKITQLYGIGDFSERIYNMINELDKVEP